MKKLFTLLAALAVALSLSMPVYAKKGKSEGHSPHSKHSKGKGTKAPKKGKAEGQEGVAPGQEKK